MAGSTLLSANGRPGGIAIFDAKQRIADLPWAGVRLARPYGSQKPNQQISPNHDQKFSPILLSSGCGVRPGHRRCPAASPAILRAAEAQPKAKPKARPKVQPHSVGFGLRAPGVGRRPSARRPGGSKNRKGTTNSSAQRGAKTDYGFRAQRTSTPQNSPQFSAPCPPRCGSAFAPPVPLGTRKMGVSTAKRRPRQFCLNWLTANRQNMPFKRAGDGVLRPVLCPRAREILSKRASAF